MKLVPIRQEPLPFNRFSPTDCVEVKFDFFRKFRVVFEGLCPVTHRYHETMKFNGGLRRVECLFITRLNENAVRNLMVKERSLCLRVAREFSSCIKSVAISCSLSGSHRRICVSFITKQPGFIFEEELVGR